MPILINVYHKNHPDGIRIYKSELQSWLDDGASLDPLPLPEKPKATRKSKAEETETKA